MSLHNLTQVLSFSNFINEAKKDVHEYGCVMIYVDMPDEIKEIHKEIPKSDIYTETGDREFGLEKESHITLLYGVHGGVTSKEITDLLADIDFTEMSVNNLSIFKSENCEVLKFDVKSKALIKANNILCKNVPFTNDHPKYMPHLTVGYLKKGSSKELIKKYKGTSFNIKPSKIVYSTPDGKVKTITKFNEE